MNIDPVTIDPAVLASLGAGDASKGAARLRLAIADMRERKPVTGPTDRPPSVRIATRGDEPALEELLALDAQENALSVAPFSLPDVQDMIRSTTRDVGRGVIGVIDDDHGRPIATTGIFAQRWWWSSAWFLMEQFTFCHPDHRRSRHAHDLVMFARWAADKMTQDVGYRVYLLHGITATEETERKVRLLAKLSNYCGAFFLYPSPMGEA